MRHRKLRRKLGVKSQHRRALLRNLARNLVRHKRIRTTLVKAKEAGAFLEQMVEIAKRGDLHSRRQLVSKLGCVQTANVLIRDVAPHFKNRHGGYTRVLRLGPRLGDCSPMAFLEFSIPIEEPGDKKKKEKKKKKVKSERKEEAEVSPKKVKEKEEKPRSPEETEAKDKEEAPKSEKKESEKRGGFLGTLRKFLKGDE